MRKLNFKYFYPFIMGTICIFLMLFHIWLAYPGYIHVDTPHSLLLTKDNWHPVFIAYTLEFLYKIAGVHTYHFLYLILIPFYSGLFIFFYAFYKRFYSYWSALLFLPVFIANLFFQNFVLHSSSLSPMWIFLCYALSFYPLLAPIQGRLKNILFYTFTALVYSIALLLRHNAIIQLFPLIFIWLYQIRLCKGISYKKLSFFFIFFSVYTLSICIFVPNALRTHPSYPAQHIILHQIAGACVPADDTSCFKDSWYQKNATFDNVRIQYLKKPLFADVFSTLQAQYKVFKGEKLEDLHLMWVQAIFKHPYNWVQHLLRFLKHLWLNPVNIENKDNLNNKRFCSQNSWLDGRYGIQIPFHERYVNLTPLKEKIYNALRRTLPFISTLTFILLSFTCTLISGFFLFKEKKNPLLVYTFFISGTGILSAFVFCFFSPTDYYRYIHPILVCPLSGFIGLCAYYFTKAHPKSFFKTIKRIPLSKGTLLLLCFIFGHALYLKLQHPNARIDFETKAIKNIQPFHVFAKDTPSEKGKKLTWVPWWMKGNGRFGHVYESNKKKAYFEIRAFRPCSILIRLIGDDVIDGKGKRMNTPVVFHSLKINGKEILDKPKLIWHDSSFSYTYQAHASERIYVQVLWDRVKD